MALIHHLSPPQPSPNRRAAAAAATNSRNYCRGVPNWLVLLNVAIVCQIIFSTVTSSKTVQANVESISSTLGGTLGLFTAATAAPPKAAYSTRSKKQDLHAVDIQQLVQTTATNYTGSSNNNNNIILGADGSARQPLKKKKEEIAYKRPWLDDEAATYYHKGFDQVAPRLVYQRTPIIPQWDDTMFQINMIQSSRNEKDLKLEDRYLFMYNPSIVTIPTGGPAGGSIRADLMGDTPEQRQMRKHMKYIVTFRLSTMSSCLNQEIKNKLKRHNLLGVALLDETLRVIRGTETMIDINAQASRWVANSAKVKFEDFRLFILNGDQLYLTDAKHLLPVRILIRGVVALPVENKPFVHFGTGNDGLSVVPLGPAYRVVGEREVVWKNHNYFTIHVPASETTNSSSHLFMELWPVGPRRVAELKLPTNKQENEMALRATASKTLTSITSAARKIEKYPVHTANAYNDLPPPAHVAIDMSAYSGSADRGSACCATLPPHIYTPLLNASRGLTIEGKNLLRRQANGLLFGFSHSQSNVYRGAFHHLSRLYAFLPYPPFTIVAMSGFFCLPPPHSHPTGKWVNQTRDKDRLYMGRRGRMKYYCPRIHFISGMTESAVAEDEIIVTYGVNDCVSQFVVIDKAEIARHLF